MVTVGQIPVPDTDLMIDPALLNMPGPSASNERPNPPAQHLPTETKVIVNGFQLQQLMDQGHLMAILINGPNDGPPRYQLPAMAVNPTQERPSDQKNAEAKAAQPWRLKRTKTADAQALKEAKELIKAKRGRGQRHTCRR